MRGCPLCHDYRPLTEAEILADKVSAAQRELDHARKALSVASKRVTDAEAALDDAVQKRDANRPDTANPLPTTPEGQER